MAPPPQASSSAARGTKRKRAEKTSTRPPVKRETPEELIGKKLHHGVQEVRKAAKKAADFELRKVVKRLKAARGEKPVRGKAKDDSPEELECQLELLKQLDPEPFANTALKTKILKDRLLSEHEGIKATIAEKLSQNPVEPSPPGSSAAKVHSRVLSSKIIADAVQAIIQALKEILDPSIAVAKDAQFGEADEEEEADFDARPVKGKKARIAPAKEADEDEEGDSGDEADADDAGWESGTIDGGDDEDGAGWESGSIDDGELRVANSSDEDEDADGEGDSSEDEDVPVAKPKPKAAAKPPAKEAQPKTKVGESTFLPSLAVGFTRGDSDASDLSDADDAPRKNRRGQRARRAIWEKKYGRNANHVKNGAPPPQDPRQRNGKGAKGGPPRSGAPPLAKAPIFKPRSTGPTPAPIDGGWPTRTTGARAAVGASAPARGNAGASAKSDDKPLHPSWEAKKRMKEKLNPSIIPGAQGTKIKFS
ncbi:Bud-site selection protein [Trametes versicolor FP-101664 SS1]|uniref:Bud-site selection protein n=1 Tax=Trametes versicolor (strain FP-101664) TaxID=717944 RepID=UPI000462267B|nr:Bud-site selection protein [Trametes versicolor FP-101664 SS1]EIW59470.1 Bud-site selection protein [Trametes versicolor FP-101664 SS1]